MDESGDGWLRESASRRAGVAQSPDGRRAITTFDPPLKEPCCNQHTVRARHPEGSSVSFARAGPRTSESRVTCRQRGGDPIQSQPPISTPFRGYRARVSGPQIQSHSAPAENQGFRPHSNPRGIFTRRVLQNPKYSGTPVPQTPGEKGGSCHHSAGVPPEGAVASLSGTDRGIATPRCWCPRGPQSLLTLPRRMP